MYKIGMISLGCPKNQVDAERILAKLDSNGFTIDDCYDGVDAVIINTCGFIDAAKQEAIENILEMAQLKEEGIVKKIIPDKLELTYGNNWLIKALPRPIYDKAKKEADDQNYESIRNGHEATVTIWDCVTLT
jgi:hypothetical protein